MYQVLTFATNKVGQSEQSDELTIKTVGGSPISPGEQSLFEVMNITCYMLPLDSRQNNGCSIFRLSNK